MYPQHKELGTEPWKLNLLAVEGRRQMLLLPCWLWFASSMQNGIPPPILVWLPLLTFQVSAQIGLNPDTNPILILVFKNPLPTPLIDPWP